VSFIIIGLTVADFGLQRAAPAWEPDMMQLRPPPEPDASRRVSTSN
jgi:hypothetical protein